MDAGAGNAGKSDGRGGAPSLTRFVGREAELGQLAEWLERRTWPFQVLYVFGSGGVGKTSLLREYARICGARGVRWIHVDARDVEPSPDGVEHAVRAAWEASPDGFVLRAAHPRERSVLAIDSYERLLRLDAWVSSAFAPVLQPSCMLVLASRRPPAQEWMAHDRWQRLHALKLSSLSHAATQEYLDARSVPVEHHVAIHSFSAGHPLTLALASRAVVQRPARGLRPEEIAPDVLAALLEPGVDAADTPERRVALEICAVVRSVNEDVLAELAEPRCVHDLFGWLRQLSFVEAGPAGLSLQEPIRRLMRADLQWRNPVRHAALLLRAREYHVARLQEARGRQADALLSSYLDLARSGADDGARDHDPFDDPPQVTAARRDDHPAILEMTRETEGPVAAERISRWLKVLPGGFLVVRTRRTTPIGFLLEVPLRPAGSLDDIGDAALRGVLIDLARGDLLREGEQATFVGAWMTRSNHQCPDDIGRFLLLHPLKRAPAGRAPAVTYFAFVDARWADPMLAVGATRVPAADFAVGGVARTVWRHDWRRSAPRAWLDAIAGFDPLDQGMTSGPVARTVAPLLGREDFVAAVRRALRDLRNTTALEDSPLLRSRIVHEHAGEAGSPTASLVALIESAAAALRSSPKRMKLHRALHRTYLDPAETQEQAAELLGLPFSTYRRHLRAAISHVADALWRSELGGRAGDR